MIKGILLDVDGTLLDSNPAHAESWVQVFTRHGINAAYPDVLKSIGMGGDKMIRKFAGVEKESELGQTLSKERSELFKSHYLPHLQPFPQTRELLLELLRRGLRLVVATSAAKAELGGLLERAGVADLIQEATSSDDAERSKPDPDIIESAAVKLQLPPDQVLMLGDTPYDIEAASRAGVKTIAVMCGGWSRDALKGALEIYRDPQDLLASLDTSAVSGRSQRSMD